MFRDGLLAGKRVLVTGGGTGLGKAIGRRYLELGAGLAICGRREAVLAETADEFRRDLGAAVETVVCDLRDAEAVEAMVAGLWASGPLDVLVNNAAGNFIAQTHKLSFRAVDAVLGIVLRGGLACTLACGRRWIEDGRPGTVLSVLTLGALQGAPFTVPSAVAKAGIAAMTKSLAVEWGPHGIRLVGVAPGPIPTQGAFSRLRPEGAEMCPPEAGVALGRVGRPDELADLCAYLVSDQAGFITGEIVVLDGGKRYLGGAGMGAEMLGWSDAAWDSLRPRKA